MPSAADVDAAVQAAKTAFYDGRWSRQTPKERSKVLLRIADLVEARQEEVARIESENSGKPYEFLSLGADLPFCVDNLRFFAAAARDTHGRHAGEYAPGYTSIYRIYRKEPCGVTALEFGTVWRNDHLPLTSETPHGGFKKSGFGKDLSLEAVHDYQITKHVMVAL